MSAHYDQLETRSPDARAADWAVKLPRLLAAAKATPAGKARLGDVDADAVRDAGALAALPVLRKSDLSALQAKEPPFGGVAAIPTSGFAHVFQSPGPIYEPGQRGRDWWRMGRFLSAIGIGEGDIVQNCFSYHMTPAGMIFENAAEAVGAAVFPAGTGQTEQQVAAAATLGVTAYAGTPDYLKVILESADASGTDLSKITRAAVGGGPLFPSLRDWYSDRGIQCLQCYATADAGNIAYESPPMEGMIVEEGVLVEIVTPGTGDPVPDGEVGELLVTLDSPDYPLIRFATGDMSAFMSGMSPCGRTNRRIKGWMGRADQAAKVKGMFVRPEQVAEILKRHDGLGRARLVVSRAEETDQLLLKVEGPGDAEQAVAGTLRDVTKLRGTVEMVAPGSLPADGIVIEDTRSFD